MSADRRDRSTIRVDPDVDGDGAVAIVWLHRPHRHNAWTGRMHAEYRAAMADLEPRCATRGGRLRAVVVTGTPPAFCVGGDATALAGHAERAGYDAGVDERSLARPGTAGRAELDHDFAWQWAYDVPIIAAVNRACAGVGLALALFCDLRFASVSAKITTAAAKLGLPAEYGMSWVLPRLVGATRAADLLLSSRVVTVGETAEWGLWNGVLPTASRPWLRRSTTPACWPRRRDHGPSRRQSASSPTTDCDSTSGRASRTPSACSTQRCVRPSTERGSPPCAADDRRGSEPRLGEPVRAVSGMAREARGATSC
jgi:enoyl-CoA hydratase/carnithine racemase